MRFIFKFPDIGEGITEGKILEWYIDKGNTVKEGDSLVKVETDKVVTDIPSPRSGTIVSRFGGEGQVINVGDTLVEIEVEDTESEEETKKTSSLVSSSKKSEDSAGVVGTLEVAGESAILPASSEGQQASEDKRISSKKNLATPVARAMAKEYKLDINQIEGTGPAGRVTKKDIQQAYTAGNTQAKKSGTFGPKSFQEKDVTYIPLSQMRKTIAKHMVTSKHSAAHMTLFEEVELSSLIALRARHKPRFAEENIHLTLLSFIMKATAIALQKNRMLNAQLDIEGDRIIIPGAINISVAIDTVEGLVVPVIHNVDNLSIKEIAQVIQELSKKAQSRALTLDELKGGTFTITNTGSFGGYAAVPIINYPQSAILGTGQIREKPIVKEGAIVVGKVMQLFLSVDHRLIDGGEATRFMNFLAALLTDPASMVLY